MKILNTKMSREGINVYASNRKSKDASIVLHQYDLGYGSSNYVTSYLNLSEAKQFQQLLGEAITKCEENSKVAEFNDDDE